MFQNDRRLRQYWILIYWRRRVKDEVSVGLSEMKFRIVHGPVSIGFNVNAYHWTWYWSNPTKFTFSKFNSIRSNLILSNCTLNSLWPKYYVDPGVWILSHKRLHWIEFCSFLALTEKLLKTVTCNKPLALPSEFFPIYRKNTNYATFGTV
jgi:hypothetical protein